MLLDVASAKIIGDKFYLNDSSISLQLQIANKLFITSIMIVLYVSYYHPPPPQKKKKNRIQSITLNVYFPEISELEKLYPSLSTEYIIEAVTKSINHKC